MQRRLPVPALLLLVSPAVCLLAVWVSVSYGAKAIDSATVRAAFLHFDPANVDHQIVLHSRLPRALGALLVGALLAVSGALMQGMTRNDLASPSMMGVAEGSVFAVTLCQVLGQGGSALGLIGFSLLGSLVGGSFVFGLASRLPDGLTPVRLAIIGTIIGTFLTGVSAALASYFQISQTISFWYNARLYQIDPGELRLALPFAFVGLLLALGISKSVTVLALGEEISAGLGQRTALVKLLGAISVTLLTGVAVALAGNIGFVGLIVPHIARFLTGMDYRWTVPCAGVLGALFLACADVLCRFLNYPFETPVGVVTSLIGVPFFLYLIRWKGGGRIA